ncbi:hypothetical protein MMC32_003170 [Xylographa parallela]|nr:hypothetical protein [Xylographa parallela]
MSLQTLPPEILSNICGYIDVANLSFVSRRIRAVVLKFVLSRLKVSFPGDRFEAISAFLRQSNSSQHVRTLALHAQGLDNAAWPRLIEFLSRLTGLKSLECGEKVALSLLAVWDQLPQCELFVRGFQMRGGLQREDYQLDPKFRLLTASCLTSLECDVCMRDLERSSQLLNHDDDDDEEDEEDEGADEGAVDELDQDMLMAQAESLQVAKVVGFLASVVPNLRRLNLIRNYWYGSIEIPKRRARKAKLVHLDLAGIENPQPTLFEHLQKSTDFEVLESLFLPGISELTREWLDGHPMSLPRLKELKMDVPHDFIRYQGQVEDSWKCFENILMNVPPLKKLKLVGDYNIVLENCLEHHSTLESLTLHEKDDVLDVDLASGIHLTLLEGILRCENLTFLDIQVHRSRGDGGIWKMLQDSRLETLILTLDCQVSRFASTFENRKEVLECAATDEALVRSIYNVSGVDYLRVTSTFAGVQAFNAEDPNTAIAVLQELTGSYEARRVEGRVHVVEMARELLPADEDAIKHDSDIMGVFRSIWPSKGGDWKDDWHSLPLVVDR